MPEEYVEESKADYYVNLLEDMISGLQADKEKKVPPFRLRIDF